MENKNLILGIAVPVIVSVIIVGGTIQLLNYDENLRGVMVFSNFIAVPLLAGVLSAYFWRDLGMRKALMFGWSVLNTALLILASAIFLKEGVICLLIVSPLILAFVVTGAFVGRMIFKRRNDTLNVSLFGVIALIVVADVFSPHQSTMKISDTLVINAPIEKVWPLVVEYQPIEMKENYFLFKIGMPSPVQSTVDGHEAGAGRKCIFSNGYVFDEKMVVYKPNQELTFDIISQPRDPEIMGHIDIRRGQFILIDNGDSTTTLVGNSWYTLYVFPSWYFDLWAESITRNVHFRVMEHIKLLSEKPV